jgi:hypothetical protein
MIQEEVYGASLSILLSLYPKILAIASGATPIGSAVAHPIERSQQKIRARNFGYIANKNKILIKLKRITRKIAYIDSVKQGCEI